uniref:Uncharacterized protein n=1 Tax=viral metagenome TaxID=1070528 RepID=A0A6C0C8V7_9ZZZZ
MVSVRSFQCLFIQSDVKRFAEFCIDETLDVRIFVYSMGYQEI